MWNILLQVKTDSVLKGTVSISDSESLPLWFWIALIEFVMIVFLILKLKWKQGDANFGDLPIDKVRNAKRSDVDMNDLMESINGSKELYKKLSRVCHPDRFINSDKQKLAQEIFQEISKNKRDFKQLTALKKRAEMELNINFK